MPKAHTTKTDPAVKIRGGVISICAVVEGGGIFSKKILESPHFVSYRIFDLESDKPGGMSDGLNLEA
jgi:hypothetical protein